MLTCLLAGLWVLTPVAFAPELDFASVPDPKLRPKWYDVKIQVRLASGRTEETGFGVANLPSETRESICDDFVRWCGSQGWTYKLDGLKLTLFAVEGDLIVGITVRTTGKDADRNPVLVPPLAYRWVPRVPPKVTWVYLTPSASGGTPLARAVSGAFASAVSAVAAPELDFAALPEGKERPQAYDFWCWVRLASGEQGKMVGDAFVGKVVCLHLHVPAKHSREELRAKFSNHIDCWYELRDEVGGLRVALWQYFETQDDGTVKKDRVIGLVIESNGPPPSVRWVLRPEVRKLLKKN